MNRKERRASRKGGGFPGDAHLREGRDQALTTEELLANARSYHQQRQPEMARNAVDRILARESGHVPALNLLGLIHQETGHHRLAVKALARAVVSDPLNAACHYNLATSHMALDDRRDAAVHFKKAITLGMSERNIEAFIFQNPAIIACINRIDETYTPAAKARELIGRQDLDAIANDIFLRCALETILVLTPSLEKFLTVLRRVLLEIVQTGVGESAKTPYVGLLCAVAQQCFINEYVYAQSGEETRKSTELRDLLLQNLHNGDSIATELLAAVAAYFPLHRLPDAKALAERPWPQAVTDLVRQQLKEPLAEAADMASIPAITAVKDRVSHEVMRQYEENPYPRWTVNPLAGRADEFELPDSPDSAGTKPEILIAGCGSGQHAFQIAHYFPHARILAVDISLPSLAYARRKTSEEGFSNIEYAQADILTLDTIGRSFDRIEAVGVLHHLAEPERGWRTLLSLLRPGGMMRVGLYSETARRTIVAVRAYIAEHGYGATVEDIRGCRQEIMQRADALHWNSILEMADFYCTSGCRDLLFHVMEHRFTIPRIKTFLNEQQLAFQGFELAPAVQQKFRSQYPAETALADLDKWQAFETENPHVFRNMYVFNVQKT